MDELLKPLTQLDDHIERVATKVTALEHRLDSFTIMAVKPQAFGHNWSAWFVRMLIAAIVILQLLIGGIIAVRLGPEGYDCTQARANWKQFCEEMHKFRPEFVCPSITRE